MDYNETIKLMEDTKRLLIKDLTEFVDEFDAKISRKSKLYDKGKAIEARWSTSYTTSSFYMDYSCIYPLYSKETAKQALELFRKYANRITLLLDVLKLEFPGIDYSIEKTVVSSARIGKELYVVNLPFDLPETHYDTWSNRMERR